MLRGELTLAVLTAERRVLLERAVRAHLEASPAPLLISTDSVRPERHLVGPRVRVIDRAWRLRWAQGLAERAGVDPELVEAAVLGHPSGTRIAAQRNTLLLLAAGGRVVTADDDVLPRAHQGADGPVRVVSTDPTTWQVFPSRDAALEGAAPIGLPAAHARWLGHEVDERGPVAVTVAGIAGDPGMSRAHGLLRLAEGSREALLAGWRWRTSRAIVRAAPVPTVTSSPLLMSASLGIDARQVLPPFPPVDRTADGLWGLSLQLLSPQRARLHLPLAVAHLPEPPRTWSPGDLWRSAGAWRMADVLGAQLQPAGSLAEAGRRLVRQARELDLTEAHARWARASRRRLVELLDTHGRAHGPWSRAVERSIRAVDASRPALDEGLARELLGTWGRLLLAWERLWAAARSAA